METEVQNAQNVPVQKYWGMSDRTYSVLMHLSQFTSFIVPILGILLPILMWATNSSNTLIKNNGRRIANWMISSIIYMVLLFVVTLISLSVMLSYGKSLGYNTFDEFTETQDLSLLFDADIEEIGMFTVISFGVLMLIVFFSFLFPIIGAVKAGKGKAWRYPLSIPFFKVKK